MEAQIKTQMEALNDIDIGILNILQEDGSVSVTELARRISLSQPATHARVRRLQEIGLIRKYVALVDREKAGFDILVFIHITLQLNKKDELRKYTEAIRGMPEVLECHHITGEYDYLLKAAVRNRHELERFVNGKLTAVPGIARIHTSLVFTEVKATTALPL